MRQALHPEAELAQADRAVQVWKDGFHQRNDAQALRLQMQRENNRTNFGETV
jgi:hypothetical protein